MRPHQPQDDIALYEREAHQLFGDDEDGDRTRTPPRVDALGARLMTEFKDAVIRRTETERRWLSDLRQYRGIYEPDVEAGLVGRSRAFLKKTRVKVKTTDARLLDLLFPANRERNFEIVPTPRPTMPAKQMREVYLAVRAALNDARPTRDQIEAEVKARVKVSADRMAQRIDDQLVEARYRKVAKRVLHDGNLYGTGVLKGGSLIERRVRTSYQRDPKTGRYVPVSESFVVPFIEHVPVWRYYPDMDVTEVEHCRYEWQHHRLTKAGFVALTERRTFSKQRITQYVEANPRGLIEQFNYESELRTIGDRESVALIDCGQFDIYERWGYIDAADLADAGVQVPEERRHESIYCNVWILPNGTVVKATMAPTDAAQRQYHIYTFDKDETSIFGEGLASIMRGDQEMINAAVRMILDNAAVTAGPQFEVMTGEMAGNYDPTNIHALKVWPRKKGDAQYPAVRVINVDSHLNELQAILQLFDLNADETTVIPKYSYAENPTQGAASTVGGLSMLMGQLNIAMKDLVANWDDGITGPFISALYHWNMRYCADESVKGDFDINARGVASLVAKELRTNQLAQFSVSLQPEERPFVKWYEVVKAKAEALELRDAVKSEKEVEEEQSSQIVQMQQQMQMQQQQLMMAQLQANVAKINAQAQQAMAAVQKVMAEVGLLGARATGEKVSAAYAAMQAAGVAAQSPQIAPAGDAILRSAGWVDATPEQGTPSAAPGQEPPPMIPNAPTAGVGGEAGIETAQLDGGNVP